MKNRKLDFDEPTLMHTITGLGYKMVTDFYAALAAEELDINNVLEDYANRLNPSETKVVTEHASAKDFVLTEQNNVESDKYKDDVLIIDRTLKGIDFQMAKCCQPVYGDEVFGFVTSGGGIKIHRTDCPNAKQMKERFGYRIVKAEWAGKGGQQYPITLKVIGNDDIGIVNNITSIISKEEKIQLRSISIDSNDGIFFGTLTIMVDDTGRLQQIMKKLKTVSYKHRKKGDLIFYSKGGIVIHIAIYIGKGRIIHSWPGRVQISSATNPRWGHLCKVKRVFVK
jgi:GTP pyrophosphokinase